MLVRAGMRRPWLRRMWIVLIALCFAASIAIPIWAWMRAKQPKQEVLPALPVARLARH